VLTLGKKYEAFWVFEDEVPQQETKEALRGKSIISPYEYEGHVVINDRGINLKGRSITTGEVFKVYIPFSKILKMEKVPTHLFETVQEKVPEQTLRIIYQEGGKNKGVYIQEKLDEMEEEGEI
jgi:hypothetical protein